MKHPRIGIACAGILFALAASPEASGQLDEAAVVALRAREFEERLGDPDWRIREAASASLARGGETLAPVLFRLLGSGDPEVRARANSALRKHAASPIVLREAFRCGEAGAAWAFRRAFPAKGNSVSKALGFNGVVKAAGYYGGVECLEPLADLAAMGDEAAVRALSLLGRGEQACGSLLKRMTPATAPAVLNALGVVAGSGAKPALERALARGTGAEKRAARLGFGHLAWVARAKRFAAALREGNSSVRREAMRELAAAPEAFRERVADFLLRAAEPEPGALLQALDGPWAIGGLHPALFGFRRGLGLVRPLAEAVRQRGPGPFSEWAMAVLSEFPEEGGARALAEGLYDSGLAPAAAGFLARCGESAGAALASAASERGELPAEVDLRKVLPEVPGDPTLNALEAMVLSDRAGVASRAPELLAEVGGPRSVRILVRGAREGRARKACIRALGRLGAEASLEILLSFWTDDPPGELVEGIGRTGDSRAAPILLAALSSRGMAPHALRGLGRLRDPRLLPVMARALTDDEIWRDALAALESEGSEEALMIVETFERAARIQGHRRRAMAAEATAYRLRSGNGKVD